MIIPSERLSEQALSGLIEEFISREGTDYGLNEVDFAEKIAQVRRQLQRGDVVVVFDAATDSCNLLTKEQASEALRGTEMSD